MKNEPSLLLFPIKATCSTCRVVKDLSAYQVRENGKLRKQCNECKNLHLREKYKQNPSIQLERTRKYYFGKTWEANKKKRAAHNRERRKMAYTDRRIHAVLKIKELRAKCKKQSIPFSITIDDIIMPEYCPVLGLKLEKGNGQNAYSVDRIDPSKGYIKGNVLVVSKLANMIKTNASPDQIMAVALFYKNLERAP